MLTRNRYLLFLFMMVGMLTGCTWTEVDHSCPLKLAHCTTIAVAPFANYTETPQANERAASITSGILRTRGSGVVSYPARTLKPSLIPGMMSPASRCQILRWARECSIPYVMNGSVTEWRYKVGLDGEPVVGVNLELIDVENNCVIWNAVGSKSGGCRIALSTVGQELIADMLSSIYFCGCCK